MSMVLSSANRKYLTPMTQRVLSLDQGEPVGEPSRTCRPTASGSISVVGIAGGAVTRDRDTFLIHCAGSIRPDRPHRFGLACAALDRLDERFDRRVLGEVLTHPALEHLQNARGVVVC